MSLRSPVWQRRKMSLIAPAQHGSADNGPCNGKLIRKRCRNSRINFPRISLYQVAAFRFQGKVSFSSFQEGRSLSLLQKDSQYPSRSRKRPTLALEGRCLVDLTYQKNMRKRCKDSRINFLEIDLQHSLSTFYRKAGLASRGLTRCFLGSRKGPTLPSDQNGTSVGRDVKIRLWPFKEHRSNTSIGHGV